MTTARLRLLGSPELCNADTKKTVRFAYSKLILLLAYLALEHKVHTREALADLFWPGLADEDARANLRRALFNLQKAFIQAGLPKSLIHADRNAIALSKEYFWIDVFEFEYEKDVNPRCMAMINLHLELYKGMFLDGISPVNSDLADWLQNRRTRYERKNVLLLERAISLAAEVDDFDVIERRCRQLVMVDCTNELAHSSLIRMYVKLGQEIVARKIYRTYHDTLQLQLGIAPSQQLAAFLDQV